MRVVRSILSVLLSFASLGSATAADMPTLKGAQAPPTSPGAGWSGSYLGWFGAVSWADPAGAYAISSASLAAAPPTIPVLDAAGSRPLSLNGGGLGIDAGENWRVNRLFVVGVEGDLAWTGLKGAQLVTGTVPNLGVPFHMAQNSRIDWESSLRLRAGITPVDPMLLYVTAGPKLAHVRYTSSYADAASEAESPSSSGFSAGWALGAGAAWAVDANWTIKTEYIYSQIAAAKGAGSYALTDGTIADVVHSSGALKENSVRVGLDYRFP